MSYKPYPNSIPEFRLFEKINGQQELQVRYVNDGIGYKGKWMPIPLEKEHDSSNNT